MRKAIDCHRESSQLHNEIIQWICSQFGSYEPVIFFIARGLSAHRFHSLPQGAIFEVMEDLECPGLQDCPDGEAILRKGQSYEVLNRMHEDNGYVMLLYNAKHDSRVRIVLQQSACIDWRGVKATYKPRTVREMVMKSLVLNDDVDQGSPIKMSETALFRWRRAVRHFKLPYTIYSDHPDQVNAEKEAGELVDAIKLPRDLYQAIVNRLTETLFTQHSRDKWSPCFFIESEARHYILADIELKTAQGIIRAYFVPGDAIIL